MDVEQNCLFEKFIKCVRKVFARCTDDFKRSFSNLGVYATEEATQNAVFHDVTKEFKSNLEKEFQLVMSEYKLPEKFALLCRLEEEQKQHKGMRAWRPSGKPDEDVQDHLRESFEEHESRLQAFLEERRAENSQLEEQAALGLRQCNALNAELELTAIELKKEQRRLTRHKN